MMKNLLTSMAIAEAVAGISLIIVPFEFSSKLVGVASLDMAGMTIARVTGAALCTLALFCWLFRTSEQARRVVTAMAFYNLVVIAVLVHAELALGVHGSALNPAIAVHMILGAWCVGSLVRGDKNQVK